MSRESRQRLRDEAKQKENRLAQGKKFIRILPFLGILLIAAGVFAAIHFQSRKFNPVVAVQIAKPTPTFKQPETLAQLLDLSPADLENVDIARMNLLCAEALPGAENLNVNERLATLDQWAQHIKSEIDRNHHHFTDDPKFFYNSEAFYKMLMMSEVLYEDYNIRYNPKWIAAPGTEQADDHFFADSRDILIHGLVGDSRMGTCSSMPVLYIALGQRLGYPLKLAKAKGHLFMRWDSPTEKFDMDATGKGLNKYDDDEYKQWPFPLSEQDIKDEDYLKSLSPKEELSVFLSIRGECQTEAEQPGDALASFNLAYKYAPTWKGNQVLLAHARARLARPTILVQQQPPMNPNIPADPSAISMQQIQPRNPFRTP